MHSIFHSKLRMRMELQSTVLWLLSLKKIDQEIRFSLSNIQKRPFVHLSKRLHYFFRDVDQAFNPRLKPGVNA
jgi:ABC-type Zn uptake system ZnuABC Zn-binding protein ZnuA